MKKETIEVFQSKFHGGALLYKGTSVKQATKKARKNDCTDCKCGGPRIFRNHGQQELHQWEATPAFHFAKKPFWINLYDYTEEETC